MRIPNSKNVVKSILSRVATKGIIRRFLAGQTKGLVTVFMLHRASGVYDGIDGHDPGELEKIIIDLKRRRFNMVSLHQVVEAVQGRGTLPCESVAFTVDDGY